MTVHVPPEFQLWHRLARAYRQGTLPMRIAARARNVWRVLRSARHVLRNLTSHRIRLHCPQYVEPDRTERPLVERIFNAFKAMKTTQPDQASCYQPSSMWQAFLDDAYSHLGAGLKLNNLDTFHYFLANFGAWKRYTAVESSVLIRSHARWWLGRLYLQHDVFGHQLRIWQWFYNGQRPLARLTYPMHGNQAGAYIDGLFVGVGSFFNEIYGSLLAGLVADLPRPVVAELGAGYGKLAHFTLRDLKAFTYVDFDLPETLCLAAYYLMKAFPDKRALLYGEAPYTPELHATHDLIFLPSWEIASLGPETVDLFMNKNSLGEMSKPAVCNYVEHIVRATRYFFHMNHDIRPNVLGNEGERALLGSEYPVPHDLFRLVFRYPDLGHLFALGTLDLSTDIFVYLYERKTHRESDRAAHFAGAVPS